MIRKIDDYYVLETKQTTYCLKRLKSGHLQHLYYGKRLEIHSLQDCQQQFTQTYRTTGNTVAYSPQMEASLEDIPLEFSSYGKGDINEPLVQITYPDGSFTNDFLYENATISNQKEPLNSLPASHHADQQLVICLKEKNHPVYLYLYYSIFEDCDVIARSSKIVNQTHQSVYLERLMSSSIDFTQSFNVISFHGGWGNEMNKRVNKITSGKLVLSSFTGTSSSRCNPFFMLSDDDTDENQGNCYGFNLIYSGNHYSSIETTITNRTRVVNGISPICFGFEIQASGCFEAAEEIISFSSQGMNQLSDQFHRFVNQHIINPIYKDRIRPVLINSWEACYFSINEEKLIRLAQRAAEVGIELLVVDDGWFGKRNNDHCSLGDWDVNLEKLPNGLKGLCDQVNQLGLQFGLWIEPEMISVDSKLYRQHPDWVMEIPGREHSEGRNQRILDLINPEVQNYIIEKMSAVFRSCNLAYVKWDMNRIFSDIYSPTLKKQQKMTNHLYVVSLYKIVKELVQRFPHILFEGCSAGGNRFDLGMLCYFPQIWASDNTDAYCRSRIQENYSYGYPLSCFTNHVSAEINHQTGRYSSLQKRFQTAFMGNLGYELDLDALKPAELAIIKEQIQLYKKYRQQLLAGRFDRFSQNEEYRWQITTPEYIFRFTSSKTEDASSLQIEEKII